MYGGLGGVRIWSVVAEGAVVLFCERGALALVLLWPELCCTANPPPTPAPHFLCTYLISGIAPRSLSLAI